MIEVMTSFDKAVRAKEMHRVLCGTACLIPSVGDPAAILLLQRTGAHGAGTWAPPGGWVENGEDPAATIVRECWEEVSLET